ncbi:MAG: acyl-ACP--UDP-N-acetylglucosamine O-acyltransferase [Planctomycetota bacterium]|nr:MAG: acyl-ACP--UDP-N-acetylglucosamine O-acyltransferase [Planctomycetota bacterium]
MSEIRGAGILRTRFRGFSGCTRERVARRNGTHARIHPSAVVDRSAELGHDVEVGPFCFVGPNVVLGDGVRLCSHVSIVSNTRVGSGTEVHAGAVLGDDPQDLAFDHTESWLEVGERCRIREGVTLHRGTGAGTVTRIGNDCFLMANSHVGHNARLGNGVILTNGTLIAGHVEIGDRAVLSGNCLVHQFTRIGRLAMMCGGSAVQKDVPPFCMTRSLSANSLIGINLIGLRRAGFTSEDIRAVKFAFDTMFRGRMATPTAVRTLREKSSHPLVVEFCDFVAASKRGVCRLFRESEIVADGRGVVDGGNGRERAA